MMKTEGSAARPATGSGSGCGRGRAPFTALCCLLLAAALLLTGCTAAGSAEMTNPIGFYFCEAPGTADFERLSGALSVQTVDLGRQDITIDEILSRYLAFCREQGYGPFPDALEAASISLADGVLTLTFNDAFSALTGVDLSLAAAALTMTLTQIEGVDGVSIRGQSAILSGDWQEVFTADDFLLQDTSPVHPEYAVQLYFRDAVGRLMARRRVLTCDDRSQLPEAALAALFAGPGEVGLMSAIPSGTQLADVSVDGSLCTVVLSADFAACDTGEAAAQAAVRAVVLTLCSIEPIARVQLRLLSGAGLQYCAIDAPLTPDPSWLQ